MPIVVVDDLVESIIEDRVLAIPPTLVGLCLLIPRSDVHEVIRVASNSSYSSLSTRCIRVPKE